MQSILSTKNEKYEMPVNIERENWAQGKYLRIDSRYEWERWFKNQFPCCITIIVHLLCCMIWLFQRKIRIAQISNEIVFFENNTIVWMRHYWRVNSESADTYSVGMWQMTNLVILSRWGQHRHRGNKDYVTHFRNFPFQTNPCCD